MLGPDQAQPNCNSAQWGNGILMTLELPLAGPTPMPHAPPQCRASDSFRLRSAVAELDTRSEETVYFAKTSGYTGPASK